MIAKDCWYVVSTSEQLPAGRPIAVEIASTPVVLYRRSDGTPVAFDDRCPHRLAPLSLGRIEADSLRCMYHGIRFAADGGCVEVPGQAAVPRSFVLRRFEVVEQDGWIWLWLGDPQVADHLLLPATPCLDRSAWQVREGEITYDVDHALMNDNLCDLSHVAFVHAATFGNLGEEGWARLPVKITDLANGLRFERWLPDSAAPPLAGLPPRVDAWIAYDHVLPGIFLMTTSFHAVGTAQRHDFGSPEGEPALHRFASTQAVTPLAPGRVRYFYTAAVPKEEPTERVEFSIALTRAAFEEDRIMLEAQQRMVARSPGRALSATTHDRAPVRFRRLTEAKGAYVPA